VNLGTPTVSDNCGIASLTNDAPSLFPVDTTIVTWIVIDIHGNSDTCYQSVIIEDTEAPTLVNCPTDTSSCDSVIFYPIPTASDNCGLASIVQVSGFGPGATFPVGITTEVWEITDIHGNISFCSFDVTIHPKPLPSLAATNVSCFGLEDGFINNNMLNGTAPYQYLWSNGDTTQHVDSLVIGLYSVIVTDAFGCIGQATIDILQPDTLVVGETHTNVSCNGGIDGGIDLTVAGGTTPYIYSWNNSSNSQDLVAISGGTYIADITDFNSCIVQIAVIIEEPDSLLASGTVIDAECLGENGGIDLSVIGGTAPYQYLWSNGDTLQDLNAVAAGLYSVLITDTNGCSVTYQNTIRSFSIMTINGVLINPLCNNDRNGSVEIVVVDGATPYSFVWSTGDTTQIITNVVAGVYTVTVTDANGCGEIVEYTLVEPENLSLELISSIYTGGYGVSAYGAEDGQIDMTIYGGTQPMNILWSTGSTAEDLYGLVAGFYTASVTDFNGCTVTDTARLLQPYVLEMPTAVTPNGDGQNDYFFVRGLEVYPNNEAIIFNRWGNKVVTLTDYKNDWRGTNGSGDPLPEGTYFVILTIESDGIELKGYIDIRR
jgi:gliding motility-associated-like protein